MTKKILMQMDCDPHPSSFDSVVAIDAGVDHLLTYASVQPTTITPLVYGAMFTRGGEDLAATAIFIGGSNVDSAESLLKAARKAFLGNIRVSLMMDANGCNTTASAAVVSASRHADLQGSKAVVLGGTGPVGRRVARLLCSDGCSVTLTSRSLDRAKSACKEIQLDAADSKLQAAAPATPDQFKSVLDGAEIIIASGAAGIELISEDTLKQVATLKVAIDLNAVPPAGIGGISVTDQAKQFGGAVIYGAIGVGGLKMRTHKAAIQSLFESNDRVLDAAEIYSIAKSMA